LICNNTDDPVIVQKKANQGHTSRNDNRKRKASTTSRTHKVQALLEEEEELSSEELQAYQVVTRKKQKVRKSWQVVKDTPILTIKVTRVLSLLAAIMEFDKLHSLQTLLDSFSSSSWDVSYSNDFQGVALYKKCQALEESAFRNSFLLMKTLVELAIWTARYTFFFPTRFHILIYHLLIIRETKRKHTFKISHYARSHNVHPTTMRKYIQNGSIFTYLCLCCEYWSC